MTMFKGKNYFYHFRLISVFVAKLKTPISRKEKQNVEYLSKKKINYKDYFSSTNKVYVEKPYNNFSLNTRVSLTRKSYILLKIPFEIII